MDEITTLVNALTRKDRIIGELEADNERLSRENSASKIRAEAAENALRELRKEE